MERVLGNLYNAQEDMFCFQFKYQPEIETLRQLVSAVASICDPMGLVAVVVIVGKALIQSAWKKKTRWDEPLPEYIRKQWRKWNESLNHLTTLKIPRCLKHPVSEEQPRQQPLHVFCDASELAFGAVAYLRLRYDNFVHVSFVMARTRVAPIRPMTIPRLELQAAVLGYRLSLTLVKELDWGEIPVIYWTDSQTVLQWLNSRSEL